MYKFDPINYLQKETLLFRIKHVFNGISNTMID